MYCGGLKVEKHESIDVGFRAMDIGKRHQRVTGFIVRTRHPGDKTTTVLKCSTFIELDGERVHS